METDAIPRYSERPLPVRRYVLGVGAKPGSEGTTPARQLEPSAYEAEWRFGIDLFNYAYYWEAHEAWEAIWSSSRDEPERTILQGFIQVAAALVQLERARRERLRLDAVHGLVLRGVAKLRLGAAQRPIYRSLDLKALLPRFEKFLREIETAGPRNLATLGPPRLELQAILEVPTAPRPPAHAEPRDAGRPAARAAGSVAPAAAAPASATPTGVGAPAAATSTAAAGPAASTAATAAAAVAVQPRAGSVAESSDVNVEMLGSNASEEDRRTLGLLLRDSLDGGAAAASTGPLSAEAAMEYWNGVLEDVRAERRVLLVARFEGIIMGAVQLELCARPEACHRAEVQKLLVMRTRWRDGIGRALMVAVEDAARVHDRGLLVLQARMGDPAEHLYERIGYKRVGLIPAFLTNEVGGQETIVLYFKNLARK